MIRRVRQGLSLVIHIPPASEAISKDFPGFFFQMAHLNIT